MSHPKGPWVALTATTIIRGKAPHREVLAKYPANGWWFAAEGGPWSATGTHDLEEAKKWVGAQ